MRRRDERGSVLVTALLALLVLGTIGATLARDSFADLGQTGRAVSGSRAFQAAEAAVDDYIAKLTEDHSYYDHFTHPAESTRRVPPSGPTVAAGQVWTGGTAWDYPLGRDAWRSLGDGVEYNLQVERPTSTQPTVRIEATGRLTGDPSSQRTVEAFVRPASITDFQMISNLNITYGEGVKTYGKIYAGFNATGDAQTVNHKGEAHADVYAEGTVTWGVPRTGGLYDGARAYTPAGAFDGTATHDTTIRDMLPNKVEFSSFVGSLTDVKGVALAGGLVLDNTAGTSWEAWRLRFQADGTITAQGCNRATPGGVATSMGAVAPTCGTLATHPVPTNGAVWVAQDAIVEGVVKGRFTVASPTDIYVGGNLTYAENGTDVVGLIAGNDMIVPQWAPSSLTWRAATLTIDGEWRTWLKTATASHAGFTFTGSTATDEGGYMSMYGTPRTYNYDQNLLYLQPPYFPVLEEAYTIVLFREISG